MLEMASELSRDDTKVPEMQAFAYWNGADQTRIKDFIGQWTGEFPNFKLYEDRDVLGMISSLFPGYLEVYQDIRIPAARSDVARLVILYVLGGLYVDVHCGFVDGASVRELMELPIGKDVILIDRAEAEGPKHPNEHIFQSSVILARKGSAYIYAAASQGFANLAAVRNFERKFGKMTYHIGALSGPGLLTNLMNVPYSPTRELRPEFAETLHVIREEDCPIMRNKYGSYRPPGTHWFHRQKTELLFGNKNADWTM